MLKKIKNVLYLLLILFLTSCSFNKIYCVHEPAVLKNVKYVCSVDDSIYGVVGNQLYRFDSNEPERIELHTLNGDQLYVCSLYSYYNYLVIVSSKSINLYNSDLELMNKCDTEKLICCRMILNDSNLYFLNSNVIGLDLLCLNLDTFEKNTVCYNVKKDEIIEVNDFRLYVNDFYDLFMVENSIYHNSDGKNYRSIFVKDRFVHMINDDKTIFIDDLEIVKSPKKIALYDIIFINDSCIYFVYYETQHKQCIYDKNECICSYGISYYCCYDVLQKELNVKSVLPDKSYVLCIENNKIIYYSNSMIYSNDEIIKEVDKIDVGKFYNTETLISDKDHIAGIYYMFYYDEKAYFIAE